MAFRCFVCGLVQESNSFNPEYTTMEDFRHTCWDGEAVLRGEAGDTADGILDTLKQYGAEIEVGVVMRSKSGGPVDHTVIDWFLEKNLSAMTEKPDAVVLSLHGATLSDTSDDVCGDILKAFRDAVGEETIIAAAFDLHGNITEQMMQHADFLCGYQTYPHLDFYKVGSRAATLAAKAVAGKSMVTVRAAVPMIAPAHGYTTDTPALKALMDRARAMQDAGRIIDFSIFQAQPWMDIPNLAGTVIVTADDEETAKAAADELAHGVWEIREVLQGTPLHTVQEVVEKALANAEDKPVVLVDSADSPNAGACGDCATVIEALLPHRDTMRMAVAVNDDAAVEKAFALGIGGVGDFTLGASQAPLLSKPVTVANCRVRSLHEGDFVLGGPAERGSPRNIGKSAVLVADKLQILVCHRSRNNGDKQFFRAFGIEPTLCDLVCVKACTSFRAGYEPISAEICNTATNGAAGPVLVDLPYTRIVKPFYPFTEIGEEDIVAAKRYR